MSEQLPDHDTTPVSPLAYWRESIFAWQEFNQRAGALLVEQVKRLATRPDPDDELAETMTADLLRTVSDLNLRQWQNLARLLDSMPDYSQGHQLFDAGALTDWFDRRRRDFEAGFDLIPATLDAMVAKVAAATPDTLSAPDGPPDDLTRIKGIGPKLSDKLNALGIYHFHQIAAWGPQDAEWVDDQLAFKGRVMREGWVDQARLLSANGDATVH